LDTQTQGTQLNATFNYTGTKQTSGINQIAAAAFKAFPNPAGDVLNVQLERSVSGALALYDLSGKLVHTQSVSGTSVQVNLSAFA
jgi:hypothetical protein